MSIENNLKRIADALEALVESKASALIDAANTVIDQTPKPAPAAAAPSQPVTPVQQPSPVAAPTTAQVAAPAASPAPVTPQVTMTVEQLNAELVEQFKRLGGRDGIDAAIKELNNGNASVTTLDPSLYGALIEKVKAL